MDRWTEEEGSAGMPPKGELSNLLRLTLDRQRQMTNIIDLKEGKRD
jgi:hypothetical protein